jgi:hypothetical protein
MMKVRTRMFNAAHGGSEARIMTSILSGPRNCPDAGPSDIRPLLAEVLRSPKQLQYDDCSSLQPGPMRAGQRLAVLDGANHH